MVTNQLITEQTYRVRVVKDVYLNLIDINEAEQVADLIANRESQIPTFGQVTSVFTEVELV